MGRKVGNGMLAFENISKRLSFECCLTRVSKIVCTFNCVIVNRLFDHIFESFLRRNEILDHKWLDHSLEDKRYYILLFNFRLCIYYTRILINNYNNACHFWDFFFYFSVILNIIFLYRNEVSLKVFDAFNRYISMCYSTRISDRMEWTILNISLANCPFNTDHWTLYALLRYWLRAKCLKD